MKRKLFMLLMALSLLLCGCGGEQTLPADWEAGWTVVAPFLAAEPMEGYSFGESDDMLGISGVYYATWTSGDARDFTNAGGEAAVIYDSQIYVVAQDCRTEEDARRELAAWVVREKQNYEIGEETVITLNGRDYTLLTMISGREGNPYGFGCAAFAVSGENAVCVELVCSDTFTGDARAVLEAFLNGLHYSE